MAIEAMEQRCDLLDGDLKQHPVNVGVLQQHLAGSLSVSVNSGPIEFCSVFLQCAQNYDQLHVVSLRAAFKRFLDVCNDGLQVNAKLMDESQNGLQVQMESDYESMKRKVLPVLVDARMWNTVNSVESGSLTARSSVSEEEEEEASEDVVEAGLRKTSTGLMEFIKNPLMSTDEGFE